MLTQKYITTIKSSRLFAGMDEDSVNKLITCFSPSLKTFSKGETILNEGYGAREITVLLEGEAEAIKESAGGEKIIISRLGPGKVLGDALCGSGRKSPVTVTAVKDCEVLAFPYLRVINHCERDCAAHADLQKNLVSLLSEEYFALHDRISMLMLKTLRLKLGAFLLNEFEKNKSLVFSIPFNREELADYLVCDRSALSRELSAMKREGLIDYYKNSFKLLRPESL